MGIWNSESDVFDALPDALMYGYKGDSGGGINSLSRPKFKDRKSVV